MPTPERLAEQFEEHWPHVRAVAVQGQTSWRIQSGSVGSICRPSSPETIRGRHISSGRSVILVRGESSRFDRNGFAAPTRRHTS